MNVNLCYEQNFVLFSEKVNDQILSTEIKKNTGYWVSGTLYCIISSYIVSETSQNILLLGPWPQFELLRKSLLFHNFKRENVLRPTWVGNGSEILFPRNDFLKLNQEIRETEIGPKTFEAENKRVAF